MSDRPAESTPTAAPQGGTVAAGFAAAALVMRLPHVLITLPRRVRALDARMAGELRMLGKGALNLSFNDAQLGALQQQARAVFRQADEKKAAVSRIEGAPLPDDPVVRGEEMRRRTAQTADLRSGMRALASEADAKLEALGEAALAQAAAHPSLRTHLEGYEQLAAERARQLAVKASLSARWSGLSGLSRAIAIGVHAAAIGAIALGVALWTVEPWKRDAGGADIADTHTSTVPDLPVGKATEPDAGADTKTPDEGGPPTRATAPAPDAPGPSATQGALPPLAASRFEGFIKSSSDRQVHRLTVDQGFAPRVLGDQQLSLNDDQRTAELTFELPEIVGNGAVITIETKGLDHHDVPVTLNGKRLGALAGSITRYGVERRQLRKGANTLRFGTTPNGGNDYDDYTVLKVSLAPIPIAHRLKLSRVPGVDTRLAIYAIGDGEPPERKLVERIDRTVSGEEAHPNWLALPGTYELEVTGDGANSGVPYELKVQPYYHSPLHDEREPNGSRADASECRLGSEVSGIVGWKGDEDWFRLSLQEDTLARIAVGGVPHVDLLLEIRDRWNNQVAAPRDEFGPGEGEEQELVSLRKGKYFVRVVASPNTEQHANQDARYVLKVREAAAQAGFEVESNGERSPNPLPLGKAIRGRLDPLDDKQQDQDWFAFEVEEPCLIRCELTPLDGVSQAVFLDNRYTRIPRRRTASDTVVTNWPVKPGVHKVGVTGQKRGGRIDRRQTYRLKVVKLSRPDHGYAVGNNARETALPRRPDQPLLSSLYPWEADDFYRLEVEDEDVVYRLKPRDPRLRSLTVELQDAEGKTLKTIANTTLENWSPKPGTYFVRVRRTNYRDRSEVPYKLAFNQLVLRPSDERELNDTRETASPLPLDVSVAGWFSPMAEAPDEDWYRIEIPAGSAGAVYECELRPDSKYVDVALHLVDAQGGTIKEKNAEGAGQPEGIANWSPPAGSYFLRAHVVGRRPTKNIKYGLRIEATGRRKAEAEFERNDTLESANPLKLDSLREGELESGNDVDLFKILGKAEGPRLFQLRVHGATNTHEVAVVDSEGKVIAGPVNPQRGVIDLHHLKLEGGRPVYARISARGRNRPRQREYTVKALDSGPWEPSREAEPNGDGHPAGALTLGAPVQGAISPYGDVDRYTLVFPAGDAQQRLELQAAPGQSLKVLATIRLPGAKEPLRFFHVNVRERPFVVGNLHLPGAELTLRLTSNNWGEKLYTIKVDPQEPSPAADVEPNQVEIRPLPLPVGGTVTGGFFTGEDRDAYALQTDGSKTYRLTLTSQGQRPARLQLMRLNAGGRDVLKSTWSREKAPAVIEGWRPPAGRYAVEVRADYGQATYALKLEEADRPEGADLEPNDRTAEAAPLAVGEVTRGVLSPVEDMDIYRLQVGDAEDALRVTLSPDPEVAAKLFLWTKGHMDRDRPYAWRLAAAGQELLVDGLMLQPGTWYLGVGLSGSKLGAYRLNVQREPADTPGRLYRRWGPRPEPQLLPVGGALSGSFAPHVNHQVEACRFELSEASAITALLTAVEGTDTWLLIRDRWNHEVLRFNSLGAGEPELLHVPYLDRGTYTLEMRVTNPPPRRGEFTIHLRRGPPETFLASPVPPAPREVGTTDQGAAVVRETKSYDAAYGALQLIVPGTGYYWLSAADDKGPHELVFGLRGQARIQAVVIDPRVRDQPDRAQAVEVLASKTSDPEAWESLGTVALPKGAGPSRLEFEPRPAARVMLRVKGNHGGRYTCLKSLRIEEAAGTTSKLDRTLARDLRNSAFEGGANLLAAHLGGKVASVSSEYSEGWGAKHLLDGSILRAAGWSSQNNKGPFEIVLESPVEAPISWLVLSNFSVEGHQNRVREIELSFSRQAADAGFDAPRRLLLQRHRPWQVYRLEKPVAARWVKLKALSNYGGGYYQMGEVMAFAEPQAAALRLVRKPYGGKRARLPGTVKAEEFDEGVWTLSAGDAEHPALGGNGVTYYDRDLGNRGNELRKLPVDIAKNPQAEYFVGWTQAGEWLDYSVTVEGAGRYTLEVRVARSEAAGPVFHLELDGADVTGPLKIPNTGGWDRWETVTKRGVALPAGDHVLRLVFDTSPTEWVANLDTLRLTRE